MSDRIKNLLLSKYFVSLCAGAFCSLAFAPIYFFVAAMVSLTVFYFLLEDEKNSAAKIGFYYGFGYFFAGTYWISISLLVDAQSFAWLIPFALILIPAVLALYFTLFAACYKFFLLRFRLQETCRKILAFTFFWLIFEILRSHLFSGFPWNLFGYIWMFDVNSLQIANIFSIYGLSVLAVITCLLPVLILQKKISFSDKIFGGIFLLLLIANFFYGYFYIDEKKIIRSETKLRLVQANIKQEMKWDGQEKYHNFLKTIALTNSKDLSQIKVVLWSETSTPYVIDDNQFLLEKLRLATPDNGLLITGGLRMDYRDSSKNEIANVWNSIFTLDKSGVIAAYDKHHLVPFGEYVPLQKFFPFVEKITDGAVGFSKGEGAQTIVTDYFSFSPLVCYEIIFPNQVTAKKSRPDLLVNLTNDAWFGNSSGPYQHFDMARMRSIEEGIPLARVANTGITAFIDPFGRVVDRINLNQVGIIDVNFIKNLEPTLFATYGYRPLILLLATIVLFSTLKPHKKNDLRQNNTS